MFLLFFSHYLGVSRRQHSFGIALGFGTFAIVELALIASWVGNHLGSMPTSLVNMAAYNGTLVIWLGYALAKARPREISGVLLQPQRWEQSLTDIHHPLPANSLIPMFEGMVDRALSRTQDGTLQSSDKAAPSASANTEAVPGSQLGLSALIARVGSKT